MYDLIIIGAGPAGLTAGLYAGRYRLNALILEKMSAGGQIILSSTIENFPGFPGGLSTQELITRFKKQVEEVGVGIEIEEVLQIEPAFKLKLPFYQIKAGSKSYEAKTVIIASGAQPKKLGVAGEDKFIGRGVSYCATCDGPLFKNKEVVVVGAGDRAIEEAIFLSGYAKGVTLIHRRAQLRASQILQERLKQNTRIKLMLESIVEEINGDSAVESIRVKNVKNGSLSNLSCQGIFIFVGIEPNTGFLKNLLETDAHGFIITGQELKTSRPGIFACGDCCKKSLYQVINACAEGAVAADSAHKFAQQFTFTDAP